MRPAKLIALCLLPILTACGGSSPASAPQQASSTAASAPGVQDLTGRPGNVFQVTWKPTTVVIDRETAIRALRSISTDETVLVFDGSVAALNPLEPGKIMLLERIALRKVAAVRREGDQLVVQVEPASLTEAIQDGEIRWNIPIRFGAMLSAGDQPGRFRLMPALYAAGPIEKSGEKNGWKYKFTAAPGPGRANLGLTLTKDVSGIETSLDATGYIPDFDTIAAIVIGGGAVSQMDFETKNLSGEVEMNISAKTKDKPGGFGKKQVKLPAILKAPFFLGMLPLTLEISSAITFTPGLGANNQLATAKFRVKYSDLNGFSFAPGASKPNGSSDGDGEIVDATGITNAGIGVVAGVSMPRLEFKLGTSSMVDALTKALPEGIADVLQKTLFGGIVEKALADAEESIKTEGTAHVQVVLVGSLLASGPISLIPCQKTTFNFRADAGADATIMGKSAGEISVDLFKKEIITTKPPNIKCG